MFHHHSTLTYDLSIGHTGIIILKMVENKHKNIKAGVNMCMCGGRLGPKKMCTITRKVY